MFQPVIPIAGLGGWRFLQQTYDNQFAAFTQSAQIQRDSDYFRENIANVTTAEDLVKDRRLLTVALGAFGLEGDIDNRFFIQKILSEGTTNDDALANRFADTRYAELSQAFGFGPGEFLKTGVDLFAEAIVDRFEAASFEIAAGNANESMRFALYAQREMGPLANDQMSNDAKWFTIMGEPPLRKIFESALNLPASFGQIDLDQQLVVFKERAEREFGSSDIGQFSDPELVQELIDKFVVRDQIQQFNSSVSAQSIALTLLRGF
ncbi:DUF1217 domain-containing protein [Sulfitobacter albidus]|uniref:DUF1217 domain-containing protein n=1 Tax=Sulfitobacter albidus TaxID=2829501 RepID=A0A975JD83_9RHOB|nr:DUF1217 domain-containing protein [Sulfitobacter albidus]QUJ76288.1 DUF1217 domain-containing protein [Sulfitobacter albidus]